ncbi:type II secretion system protein [Roseibacillus persicicus]|nr:type II secretion system protein [Roseibacillus persicicus]MDQ8190725.1 type II secretion system protein [Roseibacillus persicicus]
MKLRRESRSRDKSRGLTLIEMTVVILILLSLTGAFFASAGSIGDWQKAKEASSLLREVEVAQIDFLANNPQRAVGTLTVAEVAGYLPGSPTALPTVEDLEGKTLTIDVSVSPPVCRTSGGDVYDPSGSSQDSLWDVGK